MSLYKALLLCLILLCLIPSAQATIHPQTIANGDMESWASWNTPNNWTKSGVVERYATTHYDGSYSAMLGNTAYIIQTCDTGLTEACEVTYTAHHYDTNAVATATMEIIFYDSGSSVIDTTSIPMDDTYYWGEYSGSVYAPANTATVAIKFTATGALGYNYIDGVTVSINDVPLWSPIYISIFDESSLAQVLNGSAIVTDCTTEATANTTTGVLYIATAEHLEGECLVDVSSSGYDARRYILETPGNLSVYLSPSSDNVLISFSMIDYTNTFSYKETRLIITKISNGREITVSDSYFGASGACNVYLQSGTYYSLELSDGTNTRAIGPYIPIGSESLSLVVGDVELVPESLDYAGFNYSLSKTNESVSFVWTAPTGSLSSALNYTIFDSNDTIVYTLESDSLSGTASYTYADPSAQYKIVLSVPTTDGTLSHIEYVSGETNLIDLQISDKWYNMISIFILFIIALTFGAKSASVGALITSLSTVGLYAIGMLHCDILIISLCIILGVLAVLRGRGS